MASMLHHFLLLLLPLVVHGASFCEIYVSYLGLACDDIQVTTADGYILTINRIRDLSVVPSAQPQPAGSSLFSGGQPQTPAAPLTPAGMGPWQPEAIPGPGQLLRGRMSEAAPTAPGLTSFLPVVLDHALFLGGQMWFGFSGGPPDPLIDKRLPVLMARAGHDVWVVHHRATEFSPDHVSLTPQDFAYWDWSFDQLAALDLPAITSKVLQTTGASSVHYVGYNQGGMLPLAYASTNPAVAASLFASITAIAPLTYVMDDRSPVLRSWARNFTPDALFYELRLLNGVYNLSNTNFAVTLSQLVGFNFYTLFIPSGNPVDILTNVTGPICCPDSDAPTLNVSRSWVATSYRALVHYQQGSTTLVFSRVSSSFSFTHLKFLLLRIPEVRAGEWQKWDFLSTLSNMANYGSDVPPKYYAEKIPSAIPLLYVNGENDWLVTPAGVAKFLEALSFPPSRLTIPRYSHLDLIYSSSVVTDVFRPILQFLQNL